MSKYNTAPPSKALDDKDLDEMRCFFSQLLSNSYDGGNLEADDAMAIASLATAIDKFLMSSETERRAALTLRSDLYQIVCNSSEWEKRNRTKQKTEVNPDLNTYYTSDGKIVYLGTILGSGGEGSVYKIPNMPGKVAKIFKATADRNYMERKVEAMINGKIPSKIDNVLVNTMPEILLYDDNDRFVGYTMPWIATKFKYYDVARESATRKKFFPDLDYKGIIIIAYNLAEVVNNMHEHDVIIGDLNQSNIVVNPDGTVCLIDTDSYDFTDKKTKEHFPCAVGFPELLAPELQTVGSLKNGRFTKEADNFSLAILIFRLLMSNADPFGGIKKSDHSMACAGNEAIINGDCAYVKNIDEITIPGWAPDFNMLPLYIRELFVKTFDYTSETVQERICQRATAKEWMGALMRFYNELLSQCDRNPFHWYRSELEECPFCSRIKISPHSKKSNVKEKKKGILENIKNIITVEI